MANRNLIFVAEDNAADVNLLGIALRESGVDYELTVFADGSAALAAVLNAESEIELRPKIFILDLNLPKVGGLAILQRIRRGLPFSETPVIVWTSSDDPRDRSKSEEYGASCHVCKPRTLAAFLGLGGLIKTMLEAAPAPDASFT